MKILITLFIILVLPSTTGCASYEPLTPDDIEYNNAIDAENWRLCMQVYEDHGMASTHMDHSHQDNKKLRNWEVQSDLMTNNCRMILGKYWADGITRTKNPKKTKNIQPVVSQD